MSQQGRKSYVAFAGAVGLGYSLIVFLALSGFWIGPRFGAGDQQAVISTCFSLGLLYGASRLHEWIQRGLNHMRKSADLYGHLRFFDIVTSFAPIIVAGGTFGFQRIYFYESGLTTASWWSALQLVELLIVVGSTIEDLFKTLLHLSGPEIEIMPPVPAAAHAAPGHGAPHGP